MSQKDQVELIRWRDSLRRKIVVHNSRGAEMLGESPEDLVTVSVSKLVKEDGWPMHGTDASSKGGSGLQDLLERMPIDVPSS
jgi:hypothetical protein